MDKKIKHKIEVRNNGKGFSIWVNGRWVLDASLFKEDLSLEVSTNRMKKVKSKYKHHVKYRYDKRFK